MMIGFKDQGIRRPQDLTAVVARNQARQDWLTNEQCLAILANPIHYEQLMRQEVITATVDVNPILDGPVEDSFFLCPEGQEDGFAYAYSDKQGVKFGGKWRMTVTRFVATDYERREYVMRSGGGLKLVHYRRHNDPELKERVTVVEEAQQLEADINDYKRDSTTRNQGLLERIKKVLQRVRRRGG